MDYAKIEPEAVEALAIAYGSHKVKFRESRHSFTGYVAECYFSDSMISHFANYLEEYIGIFIAVRVTSENEAYASVPVADIPF